MRILIVEDDENIAAGLRSALVAEHYLVDVALDGRSGEEMAWSTPYALIILDVMLPGKDGRSVARDLRAEGLQTPILMLTALGVASDIIAGLDSGADDYLAKPFELAVLLARVRSLIRRHTEHRTSEIRVGDLVVDTAHRTATRAGKTLVLTSKAFALLEYLAMNAGRVVSRDDIVEHVWDSDFDPRSNVLDRLMHALRERVDHSFDRPLIRTVRGTGYILEESSDELDNE